jgi:hypothetical protein
MRKTIIFFSTFLMSALLYCAQPNSFDNPAGYNFAQPKKYLLKNSLHEISGIIFLNKTDHEIGAIEDEDGKFYYFHPDDKEYKQTKFAKKGDYEDVALFNKDIVVLRSDGSLFTFPIVLIANAEQSATKEYKNILPPGEYEGMYADNDKLFVMCKHCPDDNQKKEVSVYILQQDKNAALQIVNQFKIDLSSLHLKTDDKKPKIHPSCLARHPLTHEWYIISSVNKILIILDDQWKVKKYHRLDPVLFKQPEGIAFDANGNLYISNEGGDGTADILAFSYKQPKS